MPADPEPNFRVTYYDDAGDLTSALVTAAGLAEFTDYYRRRVIDVREEPPAPAR